MDFFFLNFLWCGPLPKSLLNLLQYCLCFMFWLQGMWDLSSPTRDWTRSTPLVLEGEVLTSEPPRKSPWWIFRRDLGTPYVQGEPWSRVSASWGQLFEDPRVLPCQVSLLPPLWGHLPGRAPFFLDLRAKVPHKVLALSPSVFTLLYSWRLARS